ncbi:30S ribosomal protein S20 [Candidatus Kaiserbacteria bacterium]|nr:MAG: 30S ribosomal protein S20 [Candidatus Kaiserbacteria bacterium]
MATSKSGKKSAKQSEAKRVFNVRSLRAMKASIKKADELVGNKDKKGAEAILPTVFKTIDKAEKRGILKKNTANRKKSRISKSIANV